MPKDYLSETYTQIRREDRAVTDEDWIKRFLHTAATGTLATAHDGQPFLNTNLFVYDEAAHAIIIHTARVGRTRSVLDENPRAAFSVMQMGRLLPAAEALEFSVEYAGVTVFGEVEIVTDEAQATHALQMLLDKYAPHLKAGADYRPPVPEELKRTAVFRLNIAQWSGKKKEVDAFSGAFWYDEAALIASVQTRPTWQGVLNAIYIAADAGSASTQLASVEAVAGKGLRGDRYFDGDGSFSHLSGEGRHLTLIAAEDLAALERESGIQLSAAASRRNLLVAGVPLNHLVGKRFKIGDVILEGMRLCEPCDTLGRYTGYGAKLISGLVHRGGLRANIIKGGTLHVGAGIRPIPQPEA